MAFGVPEEGDVMRVKPTGSNPDSGGEVVVKAIAPERAGEYMIESLDQTVAEYNDCGENELVIEAAYTGDSIGPPKTYAFPISRLRPVTTDDGEQKTTDEVLGV